MGYWGKVTSDYDFCEKNYSVTYYVAEFFSTFSSVPIVILGLYFFVQCYKYKHDIKLYLSSIGVIMVGIGSCLFHGTMKRYGQMLDEIPMLWCSLFMLYTSVSLLQFSNRNIINYIGIILLCFGIINTILYFYGGFVYFIISYIITVALVIFTTIYHSKHISSDNQLKDFAYYAIGFYAGGFFLLWIPEQVFCGNQLVKHNAPSSLSDLPIPLHAFFHITSALGPYYWLTFAIYKELFINKKSRVDITYPRTWLSMGLRLPLVEPKRAKPV